MTLQDIALLLPRTGEKGGVGEESKNYADTPEMRSWNLTNLLERIIVCHVVKKFPAFY
jgi:hypothetical protein